MDTPLEKENGPAFPPSRSLFCKDNRNYLRRERFVVLVFLALERRAAGFFFVAVFFFAGMCPSVEMIRHSVKSE